MQTLLNVLILSITEISYLLGILIAAGFLLGWIESVSNRWAYQAFGRPGVMLTACIGTPIHEAGHALMCLLFGHKIIAIKLLAINPQDSTLGYVNHSFYKHNVYQVMGNLFISLGPVLSGTAAILFFMYVLEPGIFTAVQSYVVSAPAESNTLSEYIKWSAHSVRIVFSEIFISGNTGSPRFWLFLLLSICTASHIALSKEDVSNALSGLTAIFCVVAAVNLCAALYGFKTLNYVMTVARYNIYLLSALSVSITFSLVTALIMGMFCWIRKLVKW